LTGMMVVRSDATPGQTDPAFNAGALLGPAGDTQVLIQSDGKLLVTGAFTNINGAARNGIARLNTNGSVDGSFLNGLSGANQPVYCTLQTNGQSLIGGTFTLVNGAVRGRIARLNADGSTDGAFLNGL